MNNSNSNISNFLSLSLSLFLRTRVCMLTSSFFLGNAQH